MPRELVGAGHELDQAPGSLASPRALYVLGLGLLTFLTAGAPVGILALSVITGGSAVLLASREFGAAPKGSRSRWIALAGVSFTILGFALAAAWIYVGLAYASSFGGDHSLNVKGLLCTLCELLGGR